MSIRKITTLTILSSLLLLLINIESSFAVSLPFRLAWERNSETDLAFYTVYYGTSSANYSHSADIDKQYPSFSFHEDLLARNGLSVGPDGLTLYIALTATDYSLNESGYSTEFVTSIEYSTATTTTPATIAAPPSTPPNQQGFCSTGPPLILTGAVPEEGTLDVTITDNPTHAVSASLILDLYDPDMAREGYIFINGNGPIDLPSGDYDGQVHSFEVPINPDWLLQGVNSFRFTHVDTWGYEVRNVCVHLSSLAPNQTETCSTDSPLILTGAIPEEGTMHVTATGDPASAVSASIILTLHDPDIQGEGYIYINDNGPIDLPVGDYDGQVHTFEMPINVDVLVQGDNSFRFTHVDTWGYAVRELCLHLQSSGSPPVITQTIPSKKPDITPPTGMITINQGDESTFFKLVTLSLSANDAGSRMGAGAQMMISNDNQEWFGPKPFSATKYWVLTPGGGSKTVYAKFCDEAGNWMDEPVTDNIELQLNCPKPLKLDAAAIACSGCFSPIVSEEKTVDGKTGTGWLSPLRRTLQNEHITVDLGELKVINRIDLCSTPFLLLNLFPRDFKVRGSIDNQSWIDLFTVTDYSPPLSRNDSWSFANTEVRYIQVVTTRPRQFLFFFYAAYIAEIKVFGCAEPEVEAPEVLTTSAFSQTGTQLKQQNPDTQEKEKRQIEQRTTTPGRPGRPVFILNGKP